LDLTTLKPGQTIVSKAIIFPASDTRSYLEAVGDQCSLYELSGIVPPMAVAAFALSSIMKNIELPEGAIHSAQELEFLQPLRKGDAVRYVGTVVQNTVRRGIRFLIFQISTTGPNGQILAGRTSILVPEGSVTQ
jgi:hypothetical protein